MNFKALTLSLALLMPGALSAMDEQPLNHACLLISLHNVVRGTKDQRNINISFTQDGKLVETSLSKRRHILSTREYPLEYSAEVLVDPQLKDNNITFTYLFSEGNVILHDGEKSLIIDGNPFTFSYYDKTTEKPTAHKKSSLLKCCYKAVEPKEEPSEQRKLLAKLEIVATSQKNNQNQ